MEENNILEVSGLKKYFPIRKGLLSRKTGEVRAIEDVSFVIERGTTFGLVGESGCGKTTVGKCVTGTYKPTAGSILYDGKERNSFLPGDRAKMKREIQMIFQDPYSSLDPRQSLYSILREVIVCDWKKHTNQEINERIRELLASVEIDYSMKDRYPHELSGGQRQRLGIARALACDPKLIVCDEPVSALDVSIQAQVINLMRRIQKEYGISYLFIAHDLAVVRHIAKRIAVMYLGHIVEMMDAAEIYGNPMHPYTKALLSAIPITDYYKEKERKRIVLSGEVPSPLNAPSGCPFHPRCPYASEACRKAMPKLEDRGNGHLVACHNLARVLETAD